MKDCNTSLHTETPPIIPTFKLTSLHTSNTFKHIISLH